MIPEERLLICKEAGEGSSSTRSSPSSDKSERNPSRSTSVASPWEPDALCVCITVEVFVLPVTNKCGPTSKSVSAGIRLCRVSGFVRFAVYNTSTLEPSQTQTSVAVIPSHASLFDFIPLLYSFSTGELCLDSELASDSAETTLKVRVTQYINYYNQYFKFIPKGELSDLSSRHPERSEEHLQELVERKEGKGAKEDSLAAWFAGCEGRKAQTFVDQSLNAVPSWSGLTRFSSLTHLDFNDGISFPSILADLSYSKQSANTLNVIYDTLEDYDKTIQQFGQRLVTYREACGDNNDGKDWDSIIKVHTHLHATRDIRLKGTMINMDTKTSERLNAPLRKAYLMQTNFKNVEGQLAHLDDLSMVICNVRGAVDAWDEYMSSQKEVTAELKKDSPSQFGHVYLGARCPPTKISTLALDFVEDEAFHDFRKKIQRCIVDLNCRSAQSGGSLQDGLDTALRSRQAIKVHADDQIIEHRYIRVDYESRVTWRKETNLLRCSPSFHGAPRHDTVIVMSDLMRCQHSAS
ncbi:hypothetical protein BC835DRAFT_1311226 [Cytidiella melzeri]|nr:hypothetical protein BC835DRAFT_1311226 [Cytidiella melzeri]